jgi:hypothetical protein
MVPSPWRRLVGVAVLYKETTICANAPDLHAVVYDDLVRIGRGRYALA